MGIRRDNTTGSHPKDQGRRCMDGCVEDTDGDMDGTQKQGERSKRKGEIERDNRASIVGNARRCSDQVLRTIDNGSPVRRRAKNTFVDCCMRLFAPRWNCRFNAAKAEIPSIPGGRTGLMQYDVDRRQPAARAILYRTTNGKCGASIVLDVRASLTSSRAKNEGFVWTYRTWVSMTNQTRNLYNTTCVIPFSYGGCNISPCCINTHLGAHKSPV